MPNKGTLFLIPNVIADDTHARVISPGVLTSLADIRYFMVENVRTARRYLSTLKVFERIEDLRFEVLDKDTGENALASLFSPLMDGQHAGVISESGCPGVADPGALAVAYAHRAGIRVLPLVGPSSLLMALMASGLNGQEFAFHGYLPVEKNKVSTAIRDFEKVSRQRNQTQIFIETPYRNRQLFEAFVKSLSPGTFLTVAYDITGDSENIITRPVSLWLTEGFSFGKKPCVFLFLARR